jgi:hypothetical protein
MTVPGQKRKWPLLRAMSALPPEADIGRPPGHVRKVPTAVIRAALGRDKPARSRRNGLSRRRAKRKAT